MYLCYFEHVWHSEVYFLQQVVALCVFLSIFALLNFVFNFFFVFHCQTYGSCREKEREKRFNKKKPWTLFFLSYRANEEKS